MNRNSQAHFATTPTVGIGRSKFDRSFTHKTAFDTGDIIPFYVDTEIMPGDTVKMNTAHVVRMMTPIAPVMDNANLDTYFFFVPYRLIWEHWKAFMGENETAPWIQTTEYEVPQITPPSGGWTEGSLADYMGYATEVDGYEATALPFRAYCLIWNEFFRSENLQNPVYISKGDATATGVDITDANYDPVTDTELGAAPLKACRYFDYFSGALPNAQKGPAVNVPLGQSAPIVASDNVSSSWVYPLDTDVEGKQVAYYNVNNSGGGGLYALNDDGTYTQIGVQKQIGLEADLSAAVGATVNQLRQAFAIQRFYEKQALYGSRYIEFIRGHFQVTNPDFRMQRPEYLGGMRTPININQVVQTDATSQQLGGSYVEGVWTWDMTDLSPQGNTAAYSLTSGRNKDLFTHSFTEHGILMGLAVIRTVHTYQQGMNRQFLRKKFYDFYVPEFANLGNQEIYNMEIYTQGTNKDKEVFGYQECWADYRYFPDIVTSTMRSNAAQSLDLWHWADNYSQLPTLGDEWIQESKNNVARTLAVQNQKQFFGDFYFQAIYTRPMPLYSVPGLIDHH